MAETKLQLEDWLDDLCVRFIINIPQEDLLSVERICFHIEEAQWFYEDFVRPLDPSLPTMSLRTFCLRIFQHCPLFAKFPNELRTKAFDNFLHYKTRVPVRGAIMLNEAMDSTVLVKGWKKSANWSFPRGKINKDEDDLDCAIREVYEETGFDIRKAGLAPADEAMKYIDITIREQLVRLYVFRNIPMCTVFEPKTRKEISKIEWYRLSDLPAFRKKGDNQENDASVASNANKFYMVAPFLGPLKRWVRQQRKKDAARTARFMPMANMLHEEPLTEDDIATHTDNAIPSLSADHIIKEAESELQRRVNAQPSAQGLQAKTSATDRGEKALALLRMLHQTNGKQPEQASVAPQVPRTPLDLTYSNVPQPRTPRHHHAAQPFQHPPHHAPPNFQISPHRAVSNVHFSAYLGQPRSHAQHEPPWPVMGYLNQQRHHPSPILVRPQPLPPIVQHSWASARGVLPTRQPSNNHPDVLRHAIRQAGLVNTKATTGARQDSLQHQPAPMSRSVQTDDHAMKLLDAFKSSNGRPTQPDERAAMCCHVLVEQETGRPAVREATLTKEISPAAAQYNPAQLLSHAAGQTRGWPHALPPNDAHRSSLLDMFKKLHHPPSPTRHEAAAKSGSGHVVSSSTPSGTAKALADKASAAGAPDRMQPDLDLPHRTVDILKRPMAAAAFPNGPLPQPSPVSRPVSHAYGAASAATSLPNEPAMAPKKAEKNKKHAAARQVHSALASSAGSPYGNLQSRAQSGAALSPEFGEMLQRRAQSNTTAEQQQNLLALFNNRTPPAPQMGSAAEQQNPLKLLHGPPSALMASRNTAAELRKTVWSMPEKTSPTLQSQPGSIDGLLKLLDKRSPANVAAAISTIDHEQGPPPMFNESSPTVTVSPVTQVQSASATAPAKGKAVERQQHLPAMANLPMPTSVSVSSTSQRQHNLLALFNKPPAADLAAASSAQWASALDKDRTRASDSVIVDQARTGSPPSQAINELVGASSKTCSNTSVVTGLDISRRGSNQTTPISPANANFLISLLNSAC